MSHPEILWAQRSSATDIAKNLLFITVKITDATGLKVDLTNTHLKINSDSEDYPEHFKVDLEFFDEIDAKNSNYKINGQSIYFTIRKAKAQEEYWPRLIKEKLKVHYIKTDFEKWVDEDEQDEKSNEDDTFPAGFPSDGASTGGFDMSQLADLQKLAGGAGGAGGAGDFDFSQFGSAAADAGSEQVEDFSSSDEEGEAEKSAPTE